MLRRAEAETSARRSDVEADAFIMNDEMDSVHGSAQMHLDPRATAVSKRVVQGFLEDAEEAVRHVGRQTRRNVLVAEHDGDVFSSRELAAETPHGDHDAQMQQPRRVQLV